MTEPRQPTPGDPSGGPSGAAPAGGGRRGAGRRRAPLLGALLVGILVVGALLLTRCGGDEPPCSSEGVGCLPPGDSSPSVVPGGDTVLGPLEVGTPL